MAEISQSPASVRSWKSDDTAVQARFIIVGEAACQGLSGWPLADGSALCWVDTAGMAQRTPAGLWLALDVADAGSEASLQDAADAVGDKVLAWQRDGGSSRCTVLVVDTASVVSRIAGLTLAQRLRAAGEDFFSVALSARLQAGPEAIQQSLEGHAQLQAISDGCLLIDGARFAPLDSTQPYLRHICDTLVQAVCEYGHVNVDVQDIYHVMSGRHSHMAYAVLQRGPQLVAGLLAQLTEGRLLTAAALRRARAVMVVLDGARGHLKLSEAREVMKTVSSLTAADAHFIYSSGYSQRSESELGVTVLLSY